MISAFYIFLGCGLVSGLFFRLQWLVIGLVFLDSTEFRIFDDMSRKPLLPCLCATHPFLADRSTYLDSTDVNCASFKSPYRTNIIS